MADACTDVKSDIESGTPTRYTDAFPIYIRNSDKFESGHVYIILSDPWRNPVQLVNGPILYEKRGCRLNIKAPVQTICEDIYDDIVDIFTATSRGYVFKRIKDHPETTDQNRIILDVEMLQ